MRRMHGGLTQSRTSVVRRALWLIEDSKGSCHGTVLGPGRDLFGGEERRRRWMVRPTTFALMSEKAQTRGHTVVRLKRTWGNDSKVRILLAR